MFGWKIGPGGKTLLLCSPMSHIRNLAKLSSGRRTRSIWLAGNTSRPCFLARTPKTMFSTSRRSLIEQNQHQDQREKLSSETVPFPPAFEPFPDDGSRPRLIYPVIIVTLGVSLMAYIVYNVYRVATMWPEALRKDLRQGIKHRNKRNFSLSILHFQQAWETAKSLPLNLFGPDPLLKTSGIAIVLAGVLEDADKKEDAYNVYKEALWQIQSTYLNLPLDAPQPDFGMETLRLLTAPERMRAAALAYKLGCMASQLEKPEKEEEKWLTWSVNAICTAVFEAPAGSGMENVAQIPPSPPRGKKMHIMAADMDLPSWAMDHDIAAPFEALAVFYSKRGNLSLALPLHLQAVSILIPPPPLKSSSEDRCRGAKIMGNIAYDLASTSSGRPEALAQAVSWIQKGLDVVKDTTPKSYMDELGCEVASIVLLYRLTMFQELLGEYDKARETYEAIVKRSDALGFDSTPVKQDLQALDSKVRGNDKDKTV